MGIRGETTYHISEKSPLLFQGFSRIIILMYIHYIGSEATDARIWCQGKDIALDLHKTPGQRQPHSCGAIVDGRRALGRVSSRRPYAFPTTFGSRPASRPHVLKFSDVLPLTSFPPSATNNSIYIPLVTRTPEGAVVHVPCCLVLTFTRFVPEYNHIYSRGLLHTDNHEECRNRYCLPPLTSPALP